jgi:hypothetical protein
MKDRLIHAALYAGAKATRRVLARLSRRSISAGLYLSLAGVDVDRLDREGHA